MFLNDTIPSADYLPVTNTLFKSNKAQFWTLSERLFSQLIISVIKNTIPLAREVAKLVVVPQTSLLE